MVVRLSALRTSRLYPQQMSSQYLEKFTENVTVVVRLFILISTEGKTYFSKCVKLKVCFFFSFLA